MAFIETVLIPANPALYGEPSDRHTLCVSTQVGCAYGCKFCASGLDGWKRNLAVQEIVEQILAVERHVAGNEKLTAYHDSASRLTPHALAATKRSEGASRAVDNLVVMGMGEPLA